VVRGEICANETGHTLGIEIKLSHHLCKVAPYATTDWVFSASYIYRHARQARNTYNILHKVPINATKNKGQRNLTLVRGLSVSLKPRVFTGAVFNASVKRPIHVHLTQATEFQRDNRVTFLLILWG